MSIHTTKAGTHQVKYRDSTGTQRSKNFARKRDAEKFEREVKTAKDQGRLLDPDRGAITLAKFYAEVFVPTKQVAGSTKAIWERLWGCKDPADDRVWHLRRKWGHVRLRDVNNKESVLGWHAEMYRAEATDAKVFQAHGLLVSLVTQAVELEYLPRHRLSGIRVDYQPHDTGEPWLPEDIEAVREHLLARAQQPPRGYGGVLRREHGWRRHRDATAVGIMGYAGLRIGECFALQWPMLLDDTGKGIRRHLHVTSRVPRAEGDPEDRTKTTRTRRTPRAMQRPRRVELEEHLRRDIREWWMTCGQPTEGYVLPVEPGGPRFERSGFAGWTRDVWHKSVAAVGLPKRPPKHLRKSCVSMWVRAGRDEGTIASAAGHSVAVMWGTYHAAYTARMEDDHPFDISAAIEAARRSSGRHLGGDVHSMFTGPAEADSAS